MSKRLPVLCPQEYSGVAEMNVTPCTRCSTGWDKASGRCTIYMGCEELPLVDASEVPECPIQDECQHHHQNEGPCPVRARGMICESALARAGVQDPSEHPLAFNAMMM